LAGSATPPYIAILRAWVGLRFFFRVDSCGSRASSGGVRAPRLKIYADDIKVGVDVEISDHLYRPAIRRNWFVKPPAARQVAGMPFSTLASLPAKEIFGGTIRGHYEHLDRMTVGEVDLVANTTVPLHQHPHEQVTYVISGRFEFTVGGETKVLEPGMAALIPGGVPHGGRTLTACRVLDIFSPVRDDYR